MKPLKFLSTKGAMLAPMAGVADTAYRQLCMEHGAVACISEMVSIKGLCYGDKSSADLCQITPTERPFGLQLFGSEPDYMERAVDLVQKYEPDWIDINMGCPVHKVTTIGAGSALMKTPALAQDLVRAAVRASNVPVTVKFRLGWDETSKNYLDFALAMEEAGASAVAVHGRTKAQLYSGKADWVPIRAIKEKLTIPVIGNGDVYTGADCKALYEQTSCDMVMVARGSYGNPFIFDEINAVLRGEEPTPVTSKMKMDTMLYHIRLILEHSEKPEEFAIHEARKHAAWYLTGFRGAAKFRNRCYSLSSYEEAQALAEEILALQ